MRWKTVAWMPRCVFGGSAEPEVGVDTLPEPNEFARLTPVVSSQLAIRTSRYEAEHVIDTTIDRILNALLQSL